jgi:hypothetical protein
MGIQGLAAIILQKVQDNNQNGFVLNFRLVLDYTTLRPLAQAHRFPQF